MGASREPPHCADLVDVEGFGSRDLSKVSTSQIGNSFAIFMLKNIFNLFI